MRGQKQKQKKGGREEAKEGGGRNERGKKGITV